MTNISEEVVYAIKEAEMFCWGCVEGPSPTQIINCAVRLSGEPYKHIEEAYHILKFNDINYSTCAL